MPSLTREEIDRYRRQGFLGPYALLPPEEAAARWERIGREVLAVPGPLPGHDVYARHQDSALVWELAAHSGVVGRLVGLLGPDVLLWITSFWVKRPGDPVVPWHQDSNYWGMEPASTVTAWIAMTPTSADNGRIELLPGSHRTLLPHVPAAEGELFAERADPESFDASEAIAFDLSPGEVIFFDDRVLHRSGANRTGAPRVGLGARFTRPSVRLPRDEVPFFPGHRAYLVAGEDRFGLNRLGRPPA